MDISKAVIPAAGLGTRFLPATKAVPKEMLPVVDKPAIQYVVEEAAAAGLDDVLLISGKGKDAIIDHFDYAPTLEAALEGKNDAERLSLVRATAELATVHAVRQGVPRGLGHAVMCAQEHVGDEPFAVLLGDDLIDARDALLTTMIAAQQQLGGSVIALMEVPYDLIHLYGCASISNTLGETADLLGIPAGDVVRIDKLVEKPARQDAPSNLAVIGRYVLNPAVFGVLQFTEPGKGGEIQLTDALQELARMPATEGGGVHGVVFRGRRYDTGDKLDYLKAIIRLAVDREDLGPDFSQWLVEFVEDGIAGA